MNLRKLPPQMLLTLGLACTSEGGPNTSGVPGVCLSTDPSASGSATAADTDSGTGSDTSTSTTVSDTSTGPCLGVPMDSGSGTDTGTGTGTGTGFDTGTGSETGTGSDSGSGSDDGTSSGGMQNEPPPASRAAAVERVLSRGTLPSDVRDRLRAIASGAKG